MKRVLSALFALVVCMSLALPAFALQNAAPVDSASSYNNVIGGVSFIERAGMKDELSALLSGNVTPSGIIFNVDSELNVTAKSGQRLGYTLREAAVMIDGIARPIVSVSDEYTARAVCTFFEYSGVSDFFVMSSDAALLDICREEYPIAGTVLDLTESVTAEPGIEELRAVSAEANRVGANVCLFSEDCVSADAVKYLYTRLIYVWCETEEELDIPSALELILTGAFAVVSCDTDVLYEAATEHLNENTVTRTPVNVAHRGTVNHAPQNTLEGFVLSEKEGGDAVEIDVYITSDGEVVLMHDPSTAATCSADLPVESSTLAQLRELTADKGFEDTEYAGVRIPTLREIYDGLERETVIFLEIKSSKPEAVRAVAELTEEYDFYDKIVVISFNYQQLLLTKELMPQVPCAFLTSTEVDDPADIIERLRPDNIVLDSSYNDGYFDYVAIDANVRAFPILLWTFVDATSLENFFLRGYLGLTNNIPYRFAALAKELDAHIEGDTVPGQEYTVEYDLTSYDGSKVKAKKITLSAPGQAVQISGNKITFDKAGEYKILVSAEFNSVAGTYTVCDVMHVIVPTVTTETVAAQRLSAPRTSGDADGNGVCNVTDAVLIIRELAGYKTEADLSVCDVNGDSAVNIKDAMAIIRASVGY